MEKKLCPSCFREFEGTVCPHCGGAQNDEHQLPVGTLLHGRYQIGRVLGQGGFGITYMARDRLLGNTVAVKEFYPGSTVFRRSADSTAVECINKTMIPHYTYSKERFLREASALVKFRELPEVVDILDFSEENNTAYIVMEFVKGMDLAAYVRNRGGRLTPDETFRILKPVMEALATVHKGGIVHRDISPDNIILEPMGGAKLLDFGAVRAVEDPDVEKGLNKSTEAILKQGFAPIEQYNTRGSLGPWTDEYAMCATVWYCLTGKIPEEASIRMSEGIDPDWSSIEGLPEHQQKALEKGFSCRARDRYMSMDELLEALFPGEERKAEAVPVTVPEEPVAEPVPTTVKAPGKRKAPKGRRKPLAVAITAVAAVLLVLIGAAALRTVKSPGKLYSQADELFLKKDYGAAAEIFEGLGDYEDSPARAQHCRELQVDQLQEQGKFQEAIDLIVSLKHYEGAQEELLKCHYLWANDLVAKGEYQAAIDKFTALRDFGNSAERVLQTHYQWAEALLAEGKFQEAIDKFAFLGDYKDSADMISECHYQWADALLAGGEFQEAIDKFTELGDYKDSPLRCAYGEAELLLADGKLGEAAIAFGKLGDHSDARARSLAIWDMIAARETVSGGDRHTVGLKTDGTAVAVGDNSTDQYYKGGRCDVEGWTDIVAVSAGDSHTVGLKADGTVVAVGYNGTNEHYKGGRCDVEGWTDIVAVSAGGAHTVGLKADGTVVAVGYNGTNEHYKGSRCDVEDWTDIVAVSAGYSHTVGLKADGTVVAVGNNSDGECDVEDWTDIVAVSAGYLYTVGLKADGTVVAVGSNSTDKNYKGGRCDVSGWTDIVAVSARDAHTVGLKADGTVVVTGWNKYRQCELGDWADVSAVATGYYHTLVLFSDGTLAAAGAEDQINAKVNYGQTEVSGWTDIQVPKPRVPFR